MPLVSPLLGRHVALPAVALAVVALSAGSVAWAQGAAHPVAHRTKVAHSTPIEPKTTSNPKASPKATATTKPTPATAPTNPLAGKKFYVNPDTNATRAVVADPGDATALNVIAQTPTAEWFGDWNSTSTVAAAVHTYVQHAAAANAMPMVVLYAIPLRDCGSYSRGGMPSAAAYRAWIDQVAAGFGTAPSVVIVEPDAIAALSCLTSTQQTERLGLIRYAVDKLTLDKALAVYVDAGHSNWPGASAATSRLRQVDIGKARGFSLNVSNFNTTATQLTYGDQLSKTLGDTHFVIDTSRNGRGPAPSGSLSWCNPDGRGLGTVPTSSTGDTRADAFLWIKRPGESDGSCHPGDPAAGQWFNSYALGLVARRLK